MKISIVMLAKSATDKHKVMTANAINSLRASTNAKLDIHLVESGEPTPYVANCHQLPFEFGYNRAMNFGFQKAKESELGDYVILANNDLIFSNGWLEEIIHFMNKYKMDSACPVNPGWPQHEAFKTSHPGWEVVDDWNVGAGYCGWIIVLTKNAAIELFPMPEEIEFWCADNYAAHKQMKLGHVHGIVMTSFVTHLTSSSHSLIPPEKHSQWTHGQAEIFGRLINEEKNSSN